MSASETRHGIGVSPGTAHGPVVQVAPPVRPPADEPAPVDAEAALADVKAAFETVAQSLEARAAASEDTGRQILKATALIARDKGLAKAPQVVVRLTPSPEPSRSMPHSSRRSAASSPSA